MVFINKGTSPSSLENYKLTHPNKTYDDMKKSKIRNDIYNSLITDQYGLCAYCMCRIFNHNKDDRNIQIEHFIPQSDKTPVPGSSFTLGQIKSLDYTNMLGVCDGGKKYNSDNGVNGIENLTCDSHRGNNPLSFNPLDFSNFAIRQIEYKNDGTIFSSNTCVDQDLDKNLNLNLLRLKNLRKDVLKELIKQISSGKIKSSNRQQIINNLKTPVNGELEPFFDVSVKFMEKLA